MLPSSFGKNKHGEIDYFTCKPLGEYTSVIYGVGYKVTDAYAEEAENNGQVAIILKGVLAEIVDLLK